MPPAKIAKQATPSAEEFKQLIAAWADDPVLFVKTALGATPEAWQAEALEAVRDHDKVAIRSGHGVGKTTYLAWLVLWFLMTRHPAKIAATANTAHQLSDVLWSEIGKWHRRMPEVLRRLLEVKSDKVEVVGVPDSFAVARTARREQPEALQGFHSTNMLFVIDEASGVDDLVFEVGQGAMSTAGAKTVMTGNPTRTSGYFYDAFHRMSASWKTMRVGCADSTQVSAGFLAEMAQRYGAGSNVYRVRVEGEFPLADDDSVVPAHLIASAMDRDIEPSPTAPIIWGLDVARYGDDRSALAKRQGEKLLEVRTWQGADLMETAGRVYNEYQVCTFKTRPAAIYVDSIGLGSGVLDRLRELGLPVRGVNVSEAPAVGERYLRLRDELWFRVREWLEARSCALPKDEELAAELGTPRFKILSTGKLKVDSKDEMKKRGGKSPDRADAVCLTFAAPGAALSTGSSGAWTWKKKLEYAPGAWIV